MANRQHRRGRPVQSSGAAGGRSGGPWIYREAASGVPGTVEPEVRRWPHPVVGDLPEQPPEPALHYIRCALSYQNQLLAEIKTLLEQMAAREETENP